MPILVPAFAVGAGCGTSAGSSPGGSTTVTGNPQGVTDGGSVSTDGGSVSTDGGSVSTDGTAPVGVVSGEGGPPASTGGGVPDAGAIVATQALSANILVDQFGYRTKDEKIAVLRSPVTGFDATSTFTPGPKYALVRADASQAKVLEAAPVAWNGGATDTSSGDAAWRFDFSSVTAAGNYFVLDESQNVRSDVFAIADGVYRDVLVQAMRMFYYQRDGIAKDAKYAGAAYADGAAHMGAGQDPQCQLYSASGPSTGGSPRDLHGGWFDAGDQNKYTNWAASDVLDLLRGYRETPSAFGDDTNIPESGNGVPDVLDEAKWELDWIERMQGADGSVLSIVGQDGAPLPDTAPSKATGPCTYGPATTSASLSAAAVFAMASMVFESVPSASSTYSGYAADLATRAKNAWTWAVANPEVTFTNTGKVGAGEQEVDDPGRLKKKIAAAAFLFELTGDTTYSTFFDANYTSSQLVSSGYVDLFSVDDQDALLEYTQAKGATASVVQNILAKYKGGIVSNNNLGSLTQDADPYLSFLYVYVWGSNSNKAQQGNVLMDVVSFGVDPSSNADAMRGGERYVHYVHGLNPLGLVYLSNMQDYGAAKSVTRFYHSWFQHGSPWDAVGVSMYGPPPGYLVGGANPSYAWDGCCPSSCSGVSCGAAQLSPPTGQPDQKSYLDFNGNWPLDSWQISEPDVGYQANYVRLLSKFVE